MSEDERSKKRSEHDGEGEEPDVEAHGYIPDDLGTDDPEKKRGGADLDDEDDVFSKKKK
jgi:hypothetical protein